jgi:hypothetical protein
MAAMRERASQLLDAAVQVWMRRRLLYANTGPTVKMALRQLYWSYQERVRAGKSLPSVWESGFRVFSQFDEDGIMVYLLALAGSGPARFVDFGGGDGVTASNCANLAFNFGFHGVFLDANAHLVARGRAIYQRHPDTSLYPPRFIEARVTPENVDALLRDASFEGEVDVLSIDIDGNDYWVWEAITCVQPRLVVIETHPELGWESRVVPYDPSGARRKGIPPHYLGASPAAAVALGRKRGYRLVAGNRFGFNAFFLRNDLAADLVPEIGLNELLGHERNRERMALAAAVEHLPFATP